MVQITGDGDYDEPHAYPENADAAQAAYDVSNPDSFDAWKQQRGEATGDPQNVGPMGNR